MVATLVPFDESLSSWERALYAFFAEKERRSGSRRTVEGYLQECPTDVVRHAPAPSVHS